MLSESQHIRYHRHLILKDFGLAAQEKLSKAKVLVIGAGALACPALQYLTSAGVSCIGIVDDDTIHLSNLQRQILYATDDIGKLKSETAAKKLNQLNPEIELKVFSLRLNQSNAARIIQEFDLVVDATDNFATRYIINDVCCFLNKPFIYGAVLQYEGQVAVFNLEDKQSKLKTNYRDLFPLTGKTNNTQTCSEVGVLGILPGIIGILQATEAIKLITGIGTVLINKVITYQALTSTFSEFYLSPHPDNQVYAPKNLKELESFDYETMCSNLTKVEIDVEAFNQVDLNKKCVMVDVREFGEMPLFTERKHLQLPLSTLEQNFNELKDFKKVFVFCQSGQRSLIAANRLKNLLPQIQVMSIKGGIIALKSKLSTEKA